MEHEAMLDGGGDRLLLCGAGDADRGGGGGGGGGRRSNKRHYDQFRCLKFSDVFQTPPQPTEETLPTQVGISQENNGSFTCSLCARRDLLTVSAVEMHCGSRKHQTAVKLKLKAKKAAAAVGQKRPNAAGAAPPNAAFPNEASENGAAANGATSKPQGWMERLRIESNCYNDKKHEHSTVVALGETDEAKRCMTFRVTNISANTVYQFVSWDASTVDPQFSLQMPAAEDATLTPSKKMTLTLRLTPQQESVHAFKVIFRFNDLSRTRVEYADINAKVSFVSPDTQALYATGGYYDARQKRPPKRAFYRRGAAVPGTPLPSLGDRDGLEKDRPLPFFDMTQHLHQFINDGLVFRYNFSPSQTEELTAYKQALSEADVTFNNYQTRFSCLLYLEEHQTDVDMETYFMERVQLHRHGHLLSLEVPGLAENRPSVLRGDQLFVKEYFSADHYGKKEYQGYVHDVQQTRVFVGFSQQLLSKHHAGMQFCVRFVLNRLPMRIQHRALTMIDSDESNMEHTLFPTEDTARTQGFLLPDDTQLRFFARSPEPNPEQARAIRHVVLGTSRPAPYIIFGPPGTGKTFTVVEAIKQVAKNFPSARILACAPSNSAADLIAEKLLTHLQPREVYRINAFSRNPSTIPERLKAVSNLTDNGEVCFPNKETLIDKGIRIFVTTLITAGRLVSAQFQDDFFSHVFVDEASHATEPEVVAAMAGLLYVKNTNSGSGAQQGRQVVLAGDPRQLGPILRSPFAKKFKLDNSLMERLMDLPIYRRRDQPGSQDGLFYDPLLITKLVRNYRSHPAIIKTPNKLFYNGDLVSAGSPELTHLMCGWEKLPNKERPLIFHAVVGEDMQEVNSPSFFNPFEIKEVMAYVDLLVDQRSPRGMTITQDHIGIISPYSKQVQKIRQELRRRGHDGVKVGSVEEFQGQERMVIIVSTVRSNPRFLQTDSKFQIGFLQNNKRFNVAVTRPKALLIVIGNPNVLRHNHSWSSFVEDCKVSGCMVNAHLDRTDEDETFSKLRDLLDELDSVDDLTHTDITDADLAQVSALNAEQVFHRDL